MATMRPSDTDAAWRKHTETLCKMQVARGTTLQQMRHKIERGDFGDNSRFALDWVVREEAAAHRMYMESTPEGAAIRAANAAEKAAEAAGRSAMWTCVAAVAAAVGAVATAVAPFLPTLISSPDQTKQAPPAAVKAGSVQSARPAASDR